MVIVLLSIVSAIAVPRFFSTSTFTDSNSLTELQSALNYTRNRAVTTQCTLEFRLESSGWSVLRDSDCDSSTSGCALDFSATVDEPGEGTALTGDAATTSAQDQRLFFTPDGRLYLEATNPPYGCDLPSSTVSPGTTLALDPTATLRLDGPTGYATLQ